MKIFFWLAKKSNVYILNIIMDYAYVKYKYNFKYEHRFKILNSIFFVLNKIINLKFIFIFKIIYIF